jgi:hypothetical protein
MQPLQTSVICLLVHRAFTIQRRPTFYVNRLKNEGQKTFGHNLVGQLPMDQTLRGHWTFSKKLQPVKLFYFWQNCNGEKQAFTA